MKAEELRIGNLVIEESMSYSGLKTKQISVSIRDFSNCDNLKPIPLTEEWMKKFGWGKGEFDSEYIDNVSLRQEVLGYNVDSGMMYVETNKDIIEINHIKYVHQLQNIYFALTGTELTIKE